MATTYCYACREVSVKLRLDICKDCRDKGFTAENSNVTLMGAVEPRKIVETMLGHIRFQQQLISDNQTDNITANDPLYLTPEQIDEKLKIHAAIIAPMISSWVALQTKAKVAASQMAREEYPDFVMTWFKKLTRAQQEEHLKNLSLAHQDQALKVVK